MFTGIVQEVGTVVSADGGALVIDAPHLSGDAQDPLQLGESIAVNGVDVTVRHMEESRFWADVMPETLRRTTLGEFGESTRVNLERSVRPTDRLSGHIVRGVVEGCGVLRSATPEQDAVVVRIEAPPDLLENMIVKGPVAIDGVSLTIVDVTGTDFAVSMVQYSQEHTTLVNLPVGTRVNLETDVLGRYVKSYVSQS